MTEVRAEGPDWGSVGFCTPGGELHARVPGLERETASQRRTERITIRPGFRLLLSTREGRKRDLNLSMMFYPFIFILQARETR